MQGNILKLSEEAVITSGQINDREGLGFVKLQKKLFLGTTALILIFVLAGVITNYFLLEKYYLYRSKNECMKMSKEIQEEFEKGLHDFKKFLANYGKEKNVRILILNDDLSIAEMSYYKRDTKLNVPLKKIKNLFSDKGDQKYICRVYEQKKTDTMKMFYLEEITEEKYVLFMKNTKGVRESITTANEFYLMVGCGILILGICGAAYFAKRITNPIIKMNEAAGEIAKLNFGQKVSEDRKDEIGELAHSINKMSVQLSDSIEAMKQDIHRRKQLFRNLSHELKTPVAVIKGYADGLRYGVVEDIESRKKYYRVISDECDRMDEMIRTLLEWSGLDRISFSLELTSIYVYELIEKLSGKYNNLIQEKNCSMHINGKKTIEVTADRKLLEHIFDNLLGNAVKYVTIGGKIEIYIEEKEDMIEVSFYNTCKRIPEDKLDKIWDVFYKLDAARKRGQGGHGIGLAIVKSAMELHHGKVFVKNRDDGVVFGCIFPKTK